MVAMLCGWLQREREDVIAFLREENRVLKTRLEADAFVSMTTSVNASLAELGHRLGRRLLTESGIIRASGTSSLIVRSSDELVVLFVDVKESAEFSATTTGRPLRK